MLWGHEHGLWVKPLWSTNQLVSVEQSTLAALPAKPFAPAAHLHHGTCFA